MIVSLIAALDRRRGIGTQGRLPWKLSTDLRRFKALTMGHHLIMGRKTYRSIGAPLPGRTMIVVSRDSSLADENIVWVHSIDEAIACAEQNGETEVFVIGGGELFAQTLRVADRLYLTHVHAETDADVFFPVIDDDWDIISSQAYQADEKNVYPATFVIYQRKTPRE